LGIGRGKARPESNNDGKDFLFICSFLIVYLIQNPHQSLNGMVPVVVHSKVLVAFEIIITMKTVIHIAVEASALEVAAEAAVLEVIVHS
jgi:hypothetical protein